MRVIPLSSLPNLIFILENYFRHILAFLQLKHSNLNVFEYQNENFTAIFLNSHFFECQHPSKNGPFKTSFNGLKIHTNNKVLCILSINKKYVRVFSVDKDSWNGGGGGGGGV